MRRVPRGIVANHRFAWNPARLTESGAQFVRSLVYSTPSFVARMNEVPGTRFIATLNNEHELVAGDWGGWTHAINDFIQRVSPDQCPYVVLVNEADGWGMDVDFVASLVAQVAPQLDNAGFKVCLPSVSGGSWPDYLQQLCARTAHLPIHAASAHFYGQSPDGVAFQDPSFGSLKGAIQTAYQISGLPIMMDEIGVKLHDVRSHPSGVYAGQAEYMGHLWETLDAVADMVEVACYFAIDDRIGTADEQGEMAFGLISGSDRPREAWEVFKYAASQAATVVPPPPAPPTQPGSPREAQLAAFRSLWTLVMPALPFDLGLGLCAYWVEHVSDMGSPITPEHADSEGNVYQTFTSGVWRWNASSGQVERVVGVVGE